MEGPADVTVGLEGGLPVEGADPRQRQGIAASHRLAGRHPLSGPEVGVRPWAAVPLTAAATARLHTVFNVGRI